MISVYCQKLGTSWLTTETSGLIGVVLGAVISGAVAWFIQKSNAKISMDLENKKNRVKVFMDFFIKDVIEYIDLEIKHIQRMYLERDDEYMSSVPNHQENMSSVDTSLRMFDDDGLIELFTRFSMKESEVRTEIRNEKFDAALAAVESARKMAAELKANIVEKCNLDN